MASTCIPPEAVALLKEKVQNGQIDPNEVASMLPEEKAALQSILQDFVAEKLHVDVSKGEVEEISKISKKIDAAQEKLGGDLGNPEKLQENLDFFKAKKEMDSYLASRNPANRVKVLTSTVGRGMMLFSVKSPILNIGSNIELGFSEALSRRLANGTLRGTDSKLATDYVKMANKIYQQTGYDISRMTTLDDSGVDGNRVMGGNIVHAQGAGITRKVGRVIEDIVFKQLMGAPDVAFASSHFADSVNLAARKLAKGDIKQAKQWMGDAMKLEPTTPEGKILRAQGILDAQVATWTDNSTLSRVSLGVRDLLNKATGDARLGDFLLPFIKTLANAISTGMDYAGMGIPKVLYKAVKAWKTGDLGSKEVSQSIARDIVRSGLGLSAAIILTSQLSNNDYVGAYDPTRSQIEGLRDSNTNSIRIGGKWISTDWFGPLSVSINAIMYGRKYGSKGWLERIFQTGKGVVSTAASIPGIKEASDFFVSQSRSQDQSLSSMIDGLENYSITEASSRLIPSFVSDIAKGIDPNVRVTSKGFEGVKAKIPLLRQTLPIKSNIFGEQLKSEPFLSTILFGARVKSDTETPLVKELSTVSQDTGKGLTFTDWSKSSSKTLSQFKEKVGGIKYDAAAVTYGEELKKQLTTTIAKPAYQKLSPEDKLKVLNGKDTDAMNKTLQQYGFRYKSTLSHLPKKL